MLRLCSRRSGNGRFTKIVSKCRMVTPLPGKPRKPKEIMLCLHCCRLCLASQAGCEKQGGLRSRVNSTSSAWAIGSSSPHHDLDAISDHGLENVFDGRVAKDFIRGTELGVDLPFSAGHRLRQILLSDGIGALPVSRPPLCHSIYRAILFGISFVPSVKRNGPRWSSRPGPFPASWL